MRLWNDPKCTQTLCNALKHEFMVQWGGSSAFVAKNYNVTLARTFALIAPIHPVLHRVSCSYETIPNAPKHYETHQNMSLGSNGMDRVHSLRKITTCLCGTNFCINCTSSPHFAPSFMQQWNDPKCSQTLCNARKDEVRVQWVDWVRSLQKIPMWLRGMNFCINWTSSPRLASSLMQLRNDPKCTQTLWNAPKHEFRVQWGRSGRSLRKLQREFVARN